MARVKYYNTKTKQFELLKSTTTDYKIMVTKDTLEDAKIDTYRIQGGTECYTSVINGVMFGWTKVKNIVLPEYDNGNYRVTPESDIWDVWNETFICDVEVE